MWKCATCDAINVEDALACSTCKWRRPQGEELKEARRQAYLDHTLDDVVDSLNEPIPGRPGFRRAAWWAAAISLTGVGLAVALSSAAFPPREALWNPVTLSDYMYGLCGSALATSTLAGILGELSKKPRNIDPGVTGVNPPEAFPGIWLVLAILFGMITTLRYIYVGAMWVIWNLAT